MPTVFKTKQKSGDKQLDHNSGEIKNSAKKIQDEMKKPENTENKPGLFTRFVSWVKSIFSKKTEPNLEPGATMQSNPQASSEAVPQPAIHNTLSPEQTGSGVIQSGEIPIDQAPQLPESSYSETGTAEEKIPENSVKTAEENSENSVKTTEEIPENSVKTAEEIPENPVKTVEEISENSVKTAEETPENPEKSAEKTPENSVKTAEEIPENPEKSEEKTPEKPEDGQEKVLEKIKETDPEDPEKIKEIIDEKAEKTGEKSPENSEKDPDEKASEKSEKPSVTIGNMTFNTFEEEGQTFTKSGSVKVLGTTQQWTTDIRMNLGSAVNVKKDENGKEEKTTEYFGSGGISLKLAGGLTCSGKTDVGAVVLIDNSQLTYFFDNDLCYTRDGIKLNVGNKFTDLDKVTPEKLRLLNYKTTESGEMTGSVTIDGSGVDGSAETEIVWFPTALFKGLSDTPKLKLGNNSEKKLGFSLTSDDLKASVGIDNVAMLTGTEPVTAEVSEEGKITYHFPEKYSVNLLGEPVGNDFKLAGLDVAMSQGLSEIAIPDFDLDISDAKLTGITLKLNLEDGSKSGTITVKKLEYKGLTIETLSGELGETGITAGANKFEFKIADKTISGKVEGFKWDAESENFSVSKFAVSVGELSFGEYFSLDETSVDFSLKEDGFSFNASASMSVKEFKKGGVSVSAEDLKIGFSYSSSGSGSGENEKKSDRESDKKSETKNGFSMSFGGSLNVKIGGDDPIAETKVESISYEDGEFGIEKIELQTSFAKLISGSFSGTANLTASNLKISDKPELDSLKVGIDKLAYNQKTLITKADLEVFFSEEKEKKTAGVDEKSELQTGGNSGILNGAKLSIYLLENKKGAEITADSVGYSFDYASVNFTNLNAQFFNNAEGSFTAENAEIKSGEKLNKLLNIEGFGLTASDCKITSKGVEAGKVSAEINSLVIANSLTLNSAKADLEFAEGMALKSFKISASASLGEFSITNFGLKITKSDSAKAELHADKISCGEKLRSLEISNVDGSFGSDGVSADSAEFGFKLADTGISGSLTKLSWTNANDFSVEKMEVKGEDIPIGDDLKISSAKLAASIKNKEFSIGAEASLHIDEIEKGMIKIDETDLTFKLDIDSKKDDKDKKSLSVSGSADGKIKVTIGREIASIEVGDIKYEDGEFSVGEFTADADLSSFGEKVGGSGKLSVKDLKFKKGEKPSVGAMGLAISEITYNEKTLVSGISVDIFFEDKPGSDSEKKDGAELALEDDVKGDLSGLSISVYLTEKFKGVKMNADKFSVSPKNFEFVFNKFSGEFGTDSGSKVCNFELGEASVNADLKDNKIAQLIGVEALEFSVEDAKLKDDKFTLGRVAASAKTDISLGGFSIKSTSVDAKFDDKFELEALTVGGGIEYKNYLSGTAFVTIGKDGEFSFDKVEQLTMKYGVFEGSADSFKKENDDLIIETITLKKTSDKGGEEFDDDGSLTAKLLRKVPNIEIGLKTLTFKEGVPQKPSLDEISINKIEEEFKVGKFLTGKFGYTGGEKGKFTLDVNSSLSVPDGGYEKAAEIPIITFPLSIIPVVLQGEFSLGFIAGATANFDFKAEAQKGEKTLDFLSKVSAGVDAKLGVFASAMLAANIIVAKAKAGLKMSAELSSNVKLGGSFGLSYDPDAAKFSDSFKVNKEQTMLEYSLNGALEFKLDLASEIKAFPMIFSDKKLSHSWNLFNYKLGGVKLNGSLTYNQEKDKYEFKGGKPEFTYAGSAKYEPEKVQDKLDDVGKNVTELQNGMKKINQMLQSAKSGVDPSKGSVDGIAGGEKDDLGGEIDAAKEPLMKELKQRIDNVFKESKKNSLKCHILMVDLAKMVSDNADKLSENQRNVEALEKIMGESKQALDIVGYDPGGDFTKEKYLAFVEELKKLKTDEKRLEQMTRLEPAAVVNMFKAYKLQKTQSWEEIHDKTENITGELTVNDVPEPEYKSQIKPGIYAAAMNDLEDILAKKQAELKKAEALYKKSTEEVAGYKSLKAQSQNRFNGIFDLVRMEAAQLSRQLSLNIENKDNHPELENKELVGFAKEAKEKMDKAIAQAKAVEDAEDKEAEAKAVKAGVDLTDLHKDPDNKKITNAKKALTNAKGDAYKKYLQKKSAAIEAYNKAARKKLTEDESWMKTATLNNTWQGNDYTEEITLAEVRQRKALAQLNALKQQMLESGDISTAMKGFQEFVSTEYKGTMRKLDASQKKYGLAKPDESKNESGKESKNEAEKASGEDSQSAKLTEQEKQSRRTNILETIDMLIAEATEENLDERFTVGKGASKSAREKDIKENTERHRERLETIRNQSGIVDVNMRGFGLPENRKSNVAFNTMREDNKKFLSMQTQLNEAYKQMTDYHDIIRQVLESWNEVNGLKFTGKKTAAEFAEGSGQVVELIGEIDKAEKDTVSEKNLIKITEEVKKLNIAEPQPEPVGEVPIADRIKEAQMMNIV